MPPKKTSVGMPPRCSLLGTRPLYETLLPCGEERTETEKGGCDDSRHVARPAAVASSRVVPLLHLLPFQSDRSASARDTAAERLNATLAVACSRPSQRYVLREMLPVRVLLTRLTPVITACSVRRPAYA